MTSVRFVQMVTWSAHPPPMLPHSPEIITPTGVPSDRVGASGQMIMTPVMLPFLYSMRSLRLFCHLAICQLPANVQHSKQVPLCTFNFHYFQEIFSGAILSRCFWTLGSICCFLFVAYCIVHHVVFQLVCCMFHPGRRCISPGGHILFFFGSFVWQFLNHWCFECFGCARVYGFFLFGTLLWWLMVEFFDVLWLCGVGLHFVTPVPIVWQRRGQRRSRSRAIYSLMQLDP